MSRETPQQYLHESLHEVGETVPLAIVVVLFGGNIEHARALTLNLVRAGVARFVNISGGGEVEIPELHRVEEILRDERTFGRGSRKFGLAPGPVNPYDEAGGDDGTT